MNTLQIQKPVKISAFKNLMAHVTATAITLIPAPFLYGAVIGTQALFHNDYNVFGVGAAALTAIIGSLQFAVIQSKFEKGVDIMNGKFWLREILSRSENQQKESVDKTILAIRHLTAVDQSYEPSITDHRAIASILLSSHLDDLAFTLWGHSIVKEGRYDSSRNFKEITQISALYAHAHEIAKRMNSQTLDSLQQEMIDSQLDALKNEDLFLHFNLPNVQKLEGITTEDLEKSDALKLSHQINDAVYRRASFFLDQKIITSFTPQNYDVFKEVIKASSTIDPSIALEPLLKFLNNHPKAVDWEKMTGIVNENFKGHISLYQKMMHQIQKHRSVYQKDYEINALSEQAQMSAKQRLSDKTQGAQPTLQEKNFLDGTLQNSDAIDSANNLADSQKFKPCIFISHEPDHFKDKWQDLKDQYALLQAHQDKMQPLMLTEINTTLNACLPLMITIDKKLSSFPHMNPDQTKKLLSDNLDLAISQVKKAVNEVDHTLTKELKAAKNYQTMKMNS